jgi:Secretion system C-terminal sorting domain
VIQKIISSLLLLLTIAVCNAQIVISEPQQVALQNPWGNIRPRIALDENNSPLVIWNNTDSMAVYFSKNSGAGFTNPIRINPSHVYCISYDWGGPDIASFNNKSYILYQSFGTPMYGPLYLHKSDDNANNWSDTIVVDSPDITGDVWLPALGVDSEFGGPIVAYMQLTNEAGHEWYIKRSSDGEAFTSELPLSTGADGPACDCCPAAIATSTGMEAFVYRNNNNNLRDIQAVYSNIPLEQNPTSVDVDTTDWIINACPASGPSACWNETSLTTVFRTKFENHTRVFASSYDTNTQELLTKQLYPQSGSMQQNYPIAAGAGNIIGVAWEQIEVTQRNIYFTYSTTGFDGLGTTIINLTENMIGNQTRPHMVFDGSTFHIVFSDSGIGSVQYLQINVATAIIEPIESTITLWPNPAQEFINLTFNSFGTKENYSIKVYDANGKISLESNAVNNKNFKLSTTHLKSGVYAISIVANNGETIRKSFVIQQ